MPVCQAGAGPLASAPAGRGADAQATETRDRPRACNARSTLISATWPRRSPRNSVVVREVALGTLRLLPVAPAPPARRYELVWRTARPADPALDRFLAFAPPYLLRWAPPDLLSPVPGPAGAAVEAAA